MKGLIIKDPWITKILNGEKTWEIRSKNTNIQGVISLIKSGTGMIFGTVELICSKKLHWVEFEGGFKNHQIEETHEVTYEKIYAWMLKNPIWHPEPIPYKHPQGAVIWVNL